MNTPEIADRRKRIEPGFTTAEIKSRIEAMFEGRTHAAPADRNDSRDRDEKEP
ncbi:hypothetical protein [Nocardia carnea]|uniref:hypothetical protein n=1 Tax=Nocardia carnea TaxID=37328 RepID=UPI002456B9BD|nr:hypothetical protein [Nocardia carnea]